MGVFQIICIFFNFFRISFPILCLPCGSSSASGMLSSLNAILAQRSIKSQQFFVKCEQKTFFSCFCLKTQNFDSQIKQNSKKNRLVNRNVKINCSWLFRKKKHTHTHAQTSFCCKLFKHPVPLLWIFK